VTFPGAGSASTAITSNENGVVYTSGFGSTPSVVYQHEGIACASTISGVVLADGGPLTGATVNASGPGVFTASVFTGPNGVYQITGVPPGCASVSVVVPACLEATAPASGQATVCVVGGQTATQNFSLTTLGGITGLVRGDDVPMENVTVNAAGGTFNASMQTRPDGSYEFSCIPTGCLTVSVEIPPCYRAESPSGGQGAVCVVAGSAVAQDFEIVGLGTITGSVLAGGVPLPNAIVEIRKGVVPIATCMTDIGGTYLASEVPAGSVDVAVVVPLGYLAASPPGAGAVVDVVPCGLSTQDFTFSVVPAPGQC
jgi:hypothetical protein